LASPDGGGYPHPSGGSSYGALALSSDGSFLYFTHLVLSLAALGTGGVIGTAEVRRLSLFPLGADLTATSFDDPNLPRTIANDSQQVQRNGADIAAPLGNVYSDTTGLPVAGQWRVARDGSYVVGQQIDAADAVRGKVSSHFCRIVIFSAVCQPLLRGVGTYPLSTHAALALSRGGQVAVTTDALYTQSVNGGSIGKAAASGWAVAPA